MNFSSAAANLLFRADIAWYLVCSAAEHVRFNNVKNIDRVVNILSAGNKHEL